MRLNKLALLFLIPILSSSVAAVDYYVSPTGSDSSDGSIGTPWRTIINSVQNSGGGDTVYVRQGTYNEEIWIQGIDGHGTARRTRIDKTLFPEDEKTAG